ncbi:MAG: bifunctional tetrahydrofolate synthase/dihydrofolate synthase [Methylococcaceae bacterium]|jgi:dihydrofolate synthase/folylpolyglutamate synthase
MHFDTLQGWLGWQETLHYQAIDLGLERVTSVFLRINPKRLHPPTITVAGTNGKGSCIAYLEAIYRAQGYRVGAYTSPHILRYNERIKIDGKPVSDELICETFARIEAVRGDTTLSYFEFGTLAALEIFRCADLDVQLLEVGMGGRLDAVNLIDADAALVSSIAIDHVDWLGNTREAIGQEKGGIFRPAAYAIIGDPDPPDSLIQMAVKAKAQLFRLGKNFSYQKQSNNTWDWYSDDEALPQLPLPSLKGEHQFRNAATVILAVKKMSSRLAVDETAIRLGLEAANLRGRFQLIGDDIPVLLDVGHNPQAVAMLADYLKAEFSGKCIHAVFSMMKDKDILGVLNIMDSVIYDWFFAPLTNPRAISESAIRKFFGQNAMTNVNFGFNNVAESFSAAKRQSQPGDLILVFGSFFLVSDYLAEFENK